jgi:hypothetical protein
MPTPRVILFANVGSNDLKRLPGPTDVRTRKEHGEMLATYEAIGSAFAAQVDAPILRAYLDLAIARDGGVDTVILFGTDQPTPHALDTIDGAHVLARWARDTYGDRLGDVRVVPIEVDGPHLYDRMIDWYAAILPDVVPFDPAGGRPRYLVGITGGTPAQSVGILTGAIGAWGDAVEPVYVPDTRDTGNRWQRSLRAGGSRPPRTCWTRGTRLARRRWRTPPGRFSDGWTPTSAVRSVRPLWHGAPCAMQASPRLPTRITPRRSSRHCVATSLGCTGRTTTANGSPTSTGTPPYAATTGASPTSSGG